MNSHEVMDNCSRAFKKMGFWVIFFRVEFLRVFERDGFVFGIFQALN